MVSRGISNARWGTKATEQRGVLRESSGGRNRHKEEEVGGLIAGLVRRAGPRGEKRTMIILQEEIYKWRGMGRWTP